MRDTFTLIWDTIRLSKGQFVETKKYNVGSYNVPVCTKTEENQRPISECLKLKSN